MAMQISGPEWWKLTPRFWAAVAVLAAVALGGLYLFTLLDEEGHGAEGINQTALWGLNVVNYVFLIGASAGGIVVSAAVYIWRLERYRPLARIGEIQAIVFILMAVLFIIGDLGQPGKFFNIFLYAHWSSPFLWNAVVMGSYVLIALLFLYLSLASDLKRMVNLPVGPLRKFAYDFAAGFVFRISPDRAEKLLRYLAMVALPLAVGLHSVTAWIFGLIKAQAGWNTTILAPLFVISAIVSGIALLLLTAILARRFAKVNIPADAITELGKVLGWLLPVSFYFAFAEIITLAYAQEPSHAHILDAMLAGSYAPVFWVSIVGGVLVPFLLLVNRRTRTPWGVGVASLLIAVGVFAKRIDIVLPSLLNRNLPYPPGFYWPTGLEVGIMAGMWAFGALLIVAAAKLIPLGEENHKNTPQPYTPPPEKQA